MIILKEHSLTRKRVIHISSMKLDVAERTGSCQADTDSGEAVPEAGDWIRTTEGPSDGMVWRIRSIDDQTNGAGRWSVKLEPIISTLKDRLMFGEVKPSDITGNKSATVCTAEQAFRYVLGKQSDWKLGTFPYSQSAPYAFNGDSLFSALEMITASLEDAYWDPDMSVYPFILNVRKLNDQETGEMRFGRNITGPVRISVDRNGMYTAMYPIGKNNLKLPELCVTKNTSVWGRVEHTETDQSMDTVEKLRSWAKERLANHCEPLVTITVTGLDLSRSTGEKIDSIRLNRICRLPLPRAGTTIRERVTKLSWADCIKDPEAMTVTMANSQNDVASVVNNLAKQAGGGGRRARTDAANDEEDHAWLEDTKDHVSMVAEAIIGKSPEGVDWKRVSELTADATGIHGRVTKTEGDIVLQETRIKMNDEAIRLEAQKRIDKDNSLQGEIQVASDKVGMVVGEKSGENYIKAAQICVAINEDKSTQAVIEADKIHLLGQTIANTVTADLIQSRVSLLAALRVKNLTVANRIQFEGSGTLITGSQAADIIRNLRIRLEGNTYKLQKITCGDASWTDVGSFSRAVASWNMSWSGGNLTAKAQPQGQSCWSAIAKGPASWSGRTVTIPIMAYNSTAPGIAVPTGYSVSETYAMSKGDISQTRGNREATQPTADAVLTDVTQNGYYVLTVNAAGTSKTYRLRVNV